MPPASASVSREPIPAARKPAPAAPTGTMPHAAKRIAPLTRPSSAGGVTTCRSATLWMLKSAPPPPVSAVPTTSAAGWSDSGAAPPSSMPAPVITPPAHRQRPIPTRRASRLLATAPARKPTLPTAATSPIVSAERCSSRTWNVSTTGAYAPSAPLLAVMNSAIGRSSGWLKVSFRPVREPVAGSPARRAGVVAPDSRTSERPSRHAAETM